MYWLVGILVITIMIAVLDVADDIALPKVSLLESMPSSLVWLFLIITTILLLFIIQRNALPLNTSNSSLSKTQSFTRALFFKFSRHLLAISVASFLIISSALQALSGHWQAESTKLTESMRVQAWVTVEGISDSVYDPETNSGYRQVATIQALSPLVSELSSQDLQTQTQDYLNENSLSSIEGDNNLQYRVLLNAYPQSANKNNDLMALNHLQPNDQLLMTLAIAPLATSQQALNNPSGFDSYRWLRARHIDGVATVIAAGTPIKSVNSSETLAAASESFSNSASHSSLKRLRIHIDQWRWQLRQHFYQDWALHTTAEQQAKAVTLSLLTGDRSLINRDTKDLYQLAGISHLLAISGTHVLFLAIMLASTAVLLFDRLWPALYRTLPRWQVRWWVMISAAFIYALFTGFDVPAARTAWMLLAIGLIRLTLLPISTMRVLLALAVLMAWIDPYVLWQAGYWLSFIAVALLLKYDDTLHTQSHSQLPQPHRRAPSHTIHKNNTVLTRIWLTGKRIFKLQFWLFIALLPITLLLFGKASLWGLVINLFAIGLFGWVIVPLNLLAGLCFMLLPTVADSIWALVSMIVASLHELIVWLTSLPALSGAWLYTPVNMAIILIALMAMLPWILPRGVISRWLVLPPLTLLMMTVYANQQSFSTTPTLYVLPTGDQYISAALLQYPIEDNKGASGDSHSAAGNVSWLFLADHRLQSKHTMASTLTADNLSATLEQQLRTLSVKRIEGIVVQTSVPQLTDTLSKQSSNSLTPNNSARHNTQVSELLPMTVLQLSQSLPTNQYWQAGGHERWSTFQQLYSDSNPSTAVTTISAQNCDQGKAWQLPTGDLMLQAMTGWSEIADSSVWDCSIAIDSGQPIEVVQYNAANPQQPLLLNTQKLTTEISTVSKPLLKQLPEPKSISQQDTYQPERLQSRLVLDTATHQRVWQLWSLICPAEPLATDRMPNLSVQRSTTLSTRWVTHSMSQVSPDVLSRQQVTEVISYDGKDLAVALPLGSVP